MISTLLYGKKETILTNLGGLLFTKDISQTFQIVLYGSHI